MNESKALNEALENAPISSDIIQKIESLKNLWVDTTLLEAFHKRILGIIQENPQAEEIVQNELDKTSLFLEQSAQKYTRTYQGILTQAMNDDFAQQDLRSRYGGKPANDAFYWDERWAANDEFYWDDRKTA